MVTNQYQKFLKAFLGQLPAFQAFFRSLEAEGLARFGGTERSLKVLDLGCGDGVFSQVFLGNKHQLTGLDINRRILNQAQKKGVYQRLVEGRAQKLPFSSEEFDLVLANSCLEHMDKPGAVLIQIARVLKKGGRLRLSVPSEKRVEYYLGYRLANFLRQKKLARILGEWQNRLVDHRVCWSGRQWCRALKKSGFKKTVFYYLAGPRACFLADCLMLFSLPGWLEKKLFGRWLPWRWINRIWLYSMLKKFNDKVKEEEGAVIALEAIK